MFIRLIFCLDAGIKKGLGHLSRCLSLAEEFIPASTKIHFMIRTDDENYILNYLKNRNTNKIFSELVFLRNHSDTKYELGYLKEYYILKEQIMALD